MSSVKGPPLSPTTNDGKPSPHHSLVASQAATATETASTTVAAATNTQVLVPTTTTTTTSSSSSSSRLSHNHLRPNHELTQDERAEKKALKRLLRRQMRRRTLVIRLHQALMRNDEVTATKTRVELAEFMQVEATEVLKTQPVLMNTPSTSIVGSTATTGSSGSSSSGPSSSQQHQIVDESNNESLALLSPEAQHSRQKEAKARVEIELVYQTFYNTLKKQQHQLQQQQQNESSSSEQPMKRIKLNSDERSDEAAIIPTLTTNASTSTPSTAAFAAKVALKEQQTAEARLLLLNMTRGTQAKNMFENHNALIGYTRQKFQERACLAISSLSKLDPCRQWSNHHDGQPKLPDAAAVLELRQRVWNRLTSSPTNSTGGGGGGIRSICSIGCGPGCDGTGLVKFLEHFSKNVNTGIHSAPGNASSQTKNTTTSPLVDRIVFLDWTMDRWEFFLHPLQKILKDNSFVETTQLGICNVLESLLDGESNIEARQLLLTKAVSSGEPPSIAPPTIPVCDIDLFVTSYLLTETRGKWHAFYQDIINVAKPGALFLFAEPKAWQLHTFMEQMKGILEFVWLDSSMHSPLLQALEGRVGPAVLIGMKL